MKTVLQFFSYHIFVESEIFH